MMQMQKDNYHKKPTYAEIVKQTITNATDKIALPDREATQLRNTPQLTRYDDESFTDLNNDNQHIILEQLKQINLRQAVSTHTIHTHTVERAMNEDASMPQAPPPPPPPPAAASKLYSSTGAQTHPRYTTNNFGGQTSPPPQMRNAGPPPGPQPPPPPAGGAAARTIDPNLDAHLQQQYAYAKAQMANDERNHQLTREMLQRQMATHLGPHATTNIHHQNYITQVMQGNATSSAPPPADPVTTGGSSNPKPPPPASGAAVIASTMGAPRKPETYRIASRSRSVNTRPKPPQPPPPPIEGMTVDSQQKRGILGEEEIIKKRRSNAKSAPPAQAPRAPRMKAAPKIMETETQQKRFAKDEPTGSSPKKKDVKAAEEVFDLPKTESKKAAPPADSKPARVTKPKAMKAAKPPPKAAATAQEEIAAPAAPAPSTTPAVKKKIQKEKKAADPTKITLPALIKALIKAKENDQLSATQTKQFETLVKEIREKGPAAVKKKLQAELREIYKTGVYSK